MKRSNGDLDGNGNGNGKKVANIEELMSKQQEITEVCCSEDSENPYFKQIEMLRRIAPGVSNENLMKFISFSNDFDIVTSRLRSHRMFRIEHPWIDNPPLRVHSNQILRNILESEFISCPEGMVDNMGRHCIFIRFEKNDMSDGRTPRDICRAAIYVMEHLLNRANVARNGIVGVYDFGGTTKENYDVGMPHEKGIISALCGAKLPVHLCAFYFLNTPWFFKPVFHASSIFLSKKLRNRVRIVEPSNQIYEFIRKEKFPEEYGGHMHHNQKDWLSQQMSDEQTGNVHFLEQLSAEISQYS